MAATVAAKPANVLSIFWQGRQAGLVFWELGGAWRRHPWQVLEGVGGKENQPRMLAVKSPGDTRNSWSTGRWAWWVAPEGTEASWGDGRGAPGCRWGWMLFLLMQSDVMLSSEPAAQRGPISVCLWGDRGMAHGDQAKDKKPMPRASQQDSLRGVWG